ncbi:MAG: hypothetical protein GF331_02105 [Chitinivibrionales bacterium]|nr:hypothetical protein [Chitinivibrionales bacterium]
MSDQVQRFLDAMTLEQKVGQMLCYGFCGSYPYPDIVEAVQKYHVAGFRVTPRGRVFHRYFGEDHPGAKRVMRAPERLERQYGVKHVWGREFSAREYAKTLNTLREHSLDSCAGVPLYFSLDYEGNQVADISAQGFQGFPAPMGLTASGDPSLCRRVARTIGRQLGSVGINWIHSPVLDVNTKPRNPEIGARAYSALPDTVAEYALESLRGFNEARTIATGKHFPGRGASEQDVHFDVATIEESKGRMFDIHLAPYRNLIANGLPAIMLAHSIFPSLDPRREIATLSKAVISDVLRGELAFDGVVMTDSFTMGGLVAKYEVAEAAVKAINAGVDLILLKDENALRGEVFTALVDAVRTGRLNEAQVENAARRVLEAKSRCGLLEASKGIVDLETVQQNLEAPEHEKVAIEAAQRSIVVLRDENNLLPLPGKAKVLVAEMSSHKQIQFNNSMMYTGALYESLLECGIDALYTDFLTDTSFASDAWPIIEKLAAESDIVIFTAFHERGSAAPVHIVKKFEELNKPCIMVTNSPYELVVPPSAKTVVVTFSSFTPSLRAAADVLMGKKPGAKLGFDPSKDY